MPATDPPASGDSGVRPLHVLNGGLLSRRVRRILTLAGWQVRPGLPPSGGTVGVWGRSPTAWRGEMVAARRGAGIVRIEDAFLRSLHPGRGGEAPLGLLIDARGVHFDSAAPSDLETLLSCHPLDDPALLDRAGTGMARLRRAHLTKYAAVDPALPVPEPGYVLVVDQTRGDASVRHGGGSAALFAEMLSQARSDHPRARIVIKTHPETAAGYRSGHYRVSDLDPRSDLLTDPVSPWALLDGAIAVYTVSSQMGFEAILAGHVPQVFGQPFYAGWGLTRDRFPVARRVRRLARAQLFAAAMILYPVWHDPYRDRRCDLETVLDNLEARARAWREDRHGYVASGMRLWKRPALQRVFGREKRLIFADDPARARARADAAGRPLLVWAGKLTPAHGAPFLLRCEDGFLRSRGLGAALVPPLSLVRDDLGIYYDPAQPSRLEHLIAASVDLPADALRRSERLVADLVRRGVSKYNLPSPPLPELPAGRLVLVAGQVEDDASVLRAAGSVASNAALLAAARAAEPDAVLVYKPHPDVLAGLRPGALPAQAHALADAVLGPGDPGPLLARIDGLWTMTSLLGFEALLRGVPVTCTGSPFYAGWGLTRDLGPALPRRMSRPVLAGLAHAALIDYPRYMDPVTGLPCPPEVAVDRLAAGPLRRPGATLRGLSKLQGLLASRAALWR